MNPYLQRNYKIQNKFLKYFLVRLSEQIKFKSLCCKLKEANHREKLKNEFFLLF